MGYGFGLWLWFLHRKIRLTQLWVELSWVVAMIYHIIPKYGQLDNVRFRVTKEIVVVGWMCYHIKWCTVSTQL